MARRIHGGPRTGFPLAPAAFACAVCAACGPGPLAEAGGDRLTVDAAARLIGDHSTVPGDSQVVRAVAELWVDYTLLAARLEEDGGLASLDVGLLAEPVLDQIMLDRLWDAEVEVDTVVGEEELTARFAAEMPGARATASQILLLFPRGATARQRDSVRVVAESLRGQLAAGSDFATMARRYSGDRGSAPGGGRMGTFERGEMLPPVDEAVFALRPGQLSEPVETPLGYHLLRLDGLEVPALEEVGEEFRRRIQRERMALAEAAYVAALDSASGLGPAEGALEIARSLAAAPPARLSRGAARRDLVVWDGGAYAVGEFMQALERAPDGFADGLANAPAEELDAVLRQLGREGLLLQEARARGFAPTPEEADSVAREVRAAIVSLANAIGLAPAAGAETGDGGAGLDPGPGEGADTAAARAGGESPASRVEAALAGIISGQRQIVPLGSVTFLLRERDSWRIHDSRIEATVARVAEIGFP